MNAGKITAPTVVVIFGGTGDLTKRKLIPAFYHLFLEGWLPEKFAVIGLGRSVFNDPDYRQHLHEGLTQFSRSGHPPEEKWGTFQKSITYLQSDINNPDSYTKLAG